jgi:hypothetical protein
VLSRNLSRGTEENYEKYQDSLRPGRDSNSPSPEYKARGVCSVVLHRAESVLENIVFVQLVRKFPVLYSSQ